MVILVAKSVQWHASKVTEWPDTGRANLGSRCGRRRRPTEFSARSRSGAVDQKAVQLALFICLLGLKSSIFVNLESVATSFAAGAAGAARRVSGWAVLKFLPGSCLLPRAVVIMSPARSAVALRGLPGVVATHASLVPGVAALRGAVAPSFTPHPIV